MNLYDRLHGRLTRRIEDLERERKHRRRTRFDGPYDDELCDIEPPTPNVAGGTVNYPAPPSLPDRGPKPRPELLPAHAILAVAAVMAAGEPEHGNRWTTKSARHHLSAALRHAYRHLAGEPYDHDLHAQGHGKHSHLACLAARALMALNATILAQGDTIPDPDQNT